MAEESQGARVTGDACPTRDDPGSSRGHRIGKFAAARMAVHPQTQLVARCEVGRGGRPHGATGHAPAERLAGETREVLARRETELQIKRQRTVVIPGLDQAYAGEVELARTLHDGLHQRASDAV